MELEDGLAEFHLWLGRAYGHKAQEASFLKKPLWARKVREQLERAAALDPEHVAARFDLAQYYLLAPRILGGGREKAKEQAREIQKRDGSRGGEIWGMIYEVEGKPEQAEAAYRTALRLDPDNLDVYDRLALLYEKGGRYGKALEVLGQLLKRAPEKLQVCHRLKRLSALSGKPWGRPKECLGIEGPSGAWKPAASTSGP